MLRSANCRRRWPTATRAPQIAYSDLDAATELSDLEPPDSIGDTDTLVDWAQRISVVVSTEDDNPPSRDHARGNGPDDAALHRRVP